MSMNGWTINNDILAYFLDLSPSTLSKQGSSYVWSRFPASCGLLFQIRLAEPQLPDQTNPITVFPTL